jgi:hypothetical protein
VFQVATTIFKTFKEKKMKKLIAIVAALVMVSSVAYAADWNFYGSARVRMEWTSIDTIGSSAASVEDFVMPMFGNSRIGANVKVSDELSGRFEYGATPNLRLLYGTWNFGSGKLTVGQDYGPLNMFYSGQIANDDINGLPWGGVYSGRVPQVKLTFGDFEIALVTPNETVNGIPGTAESKMPAIEASYKLKMDAAHVHVAGGYNTFTMVSGGTEYDVDSWLIAVGAGVNFGMMYLQGNVYTGVNGGNLILLDVNGTYGNFGDGLADDTGTTVLDNETFGFLLVGGAKLNDMFKVEIGYGYAETDLDQATTEDEVETFYANATITLAPGVFITPEIGIVDYNETTQQEVTYGAIRWQINF